MQGCLVIPGLSKGTVGEYPLVVNDVYQYFLNGPFVIGISEKQFFFGQGVDVFLDAKEIFPKVLQNLAVIFQEVQVDAGIRWIFSRNGFLNLSVFAHTRFG